MAHSKNQLRVLVYDDWQYNVYHESTPSWDSVLCYQLDSVEWSMPDDDLIEFLILEGVILHNQGNVHTEGELYDVEVHNKGNVTLTCAYCEGGEWFQQGKNQQLHGRVVLQEGNSLAATEFRDAIDTVLTYADAVGNDDWKAAIEVLTKWVGEQHG